MNTPARHALPLTPRHGALGTNSPRSTPRRRKQIKLLNPAGPSSPATPRAPGAFPISPARPARQALPPALRGPAKSTQSPARPVLAERRPRDDNLLSQPSLASEGDKSRGIDIKPTSAAERPSSSIPAPPEGNVHEHEAADSAPDIGMLQMFLAKASDEAFDAHNAEMALLGTNVDAATRVVRILELELEDAKAQASTWMAAAKAYRTKYEAADDELMEQRREIESKHNEIEALREEIERGISRGPFLGDANSAAAEELEEVRARLEAKDEEVERLQGELESRDDEIVRISDEAGADDDELAQLRDEVGAKDDALGALREELATKDEELAILRDGVLAKDDALAGLGADLAGKDDELSELQDQLAAKDTELDGVRQELAAAKEELASRQDTDTYELRAREEELRQATDELRETREALQRATDDLQRTAGELADVRNRFDVARDELRTSRDECRGAQAELDEAKDELERVKYELEDTQARLRVPSDKLMDARDKYATSQMEVERLRGELAESARQLKTAKASSDETVTRLRRRLARLTTDYEEMQCAVSSAQMEAEVNKRQYNRLKASLPPDIMTPAGLKSVRRAVPTPRAHADSLKTPLASKENRHAVGFTR